MVWRVGWWQVEIGEDSENLHTLYKNTTLGSERKFGKAEIKLPGNLDVEPGIDRGNVLRK